MSRIRSAVVYLNQLRPNAWNPNRMNDEMYRKELASIKKFGYVNPILVREQGADYEIIDGEHRWRALNQLGYEEAEVTVIEGLADEEAKQLTIVLNETRGKADPKRLGELLTDLLRDVPKTDLLDLLPLSPVEFDRLAGLEDFDWAGLEEVSRTSAETRSWVERTYRLPQEAAAVIDEALATAKDGQELPDWQALEAIAADFLAGVNMSATPSPQLTVPASTAGSR